MEERFEFPKGFLWGAATSAHQVEGGNRNDWTEWEALHAVRLSQEASQRAAEQVRVLGGIAPVLPPEAFEVGNYRSGLSCDHFHRFREDFDIAKQLGHNAHRFSLEWSRIEPEEGVFDETAIDHYRSVISALQEHGMEPLITLWHWTNPLWVRDQGGWENPKTVHDFERYVKRIADELGGIARLWMTLNEPSTYIGVSYIIGHWPPRVRSFWRANKVFHNLVAAHRMAYGTLHHIIPHAVVGVGNYLAYVEPYRRYIRNRLAAWLSDYLRNGRFLEAFSGYQDFIGVQYYHHDAIHVKFGRGRWGPLEVRNENQRVNDLGWEIFPEGIYHLLRRVARYGKPIYITENGTADRDDDHRSAFIRDHLRWVARAAAEGVDIRGYFHWSLLDNFEWDKGFWPRFGLVEIDYETLERKIRPSAWEYKKIIEANAIEIP